MEKPMLTKIDEQETTSVVLQLLGRAIRKSTPNYLCGPILSTNLLHLPI